MSGWTDPSPGAEVPGRGGGGPEGRNRALVPSACLALSLLLAVLGSFGGAAPLHAQAAAELLARCHGGEGSRMEPCRLGVAAAHALQGGVGLLVGAGGPVPASPNTAGQRLHGSPRIVVDGGLAAAAFRHPDLTAPGAPEARRVVTAPRITVGAGVFEGFSPAPTVGGVGALDLLGELRLLPVPSFDGLGGRAWALGVGARVGVIRESFSLPGVTLSAMHRRSGALEYGRGAGAPAGIRVQPRVTSLRGVVGKDLMELGVSGGVQLDRIRGAARVQPLPQGAGGGGGQGTLPVDRTTWFLGVNRTWVVSQVALDLGWSPGPGSAPGIAGAVSGDPGSGVSGALTFRVLY